MNHLKLFLNISNQFHPGLESIGEYLVRQGQLLVEIGTKMDEARLNNVQQAIKPEELGVESDWETEGNY